MIAAILSARPFRVGEYALVTDDGTVIPARNKRERPRTISFIQHRRVLKRSRRHKAKRTVIVVGQSISSCKFGECVLIKTVI